MVFQLEKEHIVQIIFVCTGNTCRSPMAEWYFRELCHRAGKEIAVSSAGTMAGNGASPSVFSVEVLMKCENINLSSHKSSALTHGAVDQADLVVTMGRSHKMQICSAWPEVEQKVLTLGAFKSDGRDIADPFGGSYEIYEQCFKGMKEALDNLFLDIVNS